MTVIHNTFVKEFVGIVLDDRDFHSCFIRGRAHAEDLGVRELRSRKHDHRLVAWDVLGNVTVVTKQYAVLQFSEAEFKASFKN